MLRYFLLSMSIVLHIPMIRSEIVVKRVDVATIDTAKLHIENELVWNSRYRYMAVLGICGLMAGTAYCGYRWLHSSSATPSALSTIGTNQPHATALANMPTAEQLAQWHATMEQLGKHMEQYAPQFKSDPALLPRVLHVPRRLAGSAWEAFKQLFSPEAYFAHLTFGVISSYLGGSVIKDNTTRYFTHFFGIVDSSIDSVVSYASTLFHRTNLNWFKATHVQLRFVADILEYRAAILEGRPVQIPANSVSNSPLVITSVETELSRSEFVAYWNLFVQQMELVVAFMEYISATHHKQFLQGRIKGICQTIISLVNASATYIENQLNDPSLGTCVAEFVENEDKVHDTVTAARIPQLYDHIHNLRAQLGQELETFSKFESFPVWMQSTPSQDVVL